MFYKQGTILTIYVDNLLITGDSRTDIDALKAFLSKQFKISNLGAYHFYLGMEVTRDRPRRILRLSQKAYLEKVLRDHGIKNFALYKMLIKTYTCPMPTKPEYTAIAIFRRQY